MSCPRLYCASRCSNVLFLSIHGNNQHCSSTCFGRIDVHTTEYRAILQSVLQSDGRGEQARTR